MKIYDKLGEIVPADAGIAREMLEDIVDDCVRAGSWEAAMSCWGDQYDVLTRLHEEGFLSEDEVSEAFQTALRKRRDRSKEPVGEYPPKSWADDAAVPSPSPSRFALVPFGSLHVDGKSNYLVKGLIPLVGLVVVWGPPKCGKSFWVSDLALRVALGWEYRGRKVKQGAIVYCAMEGAEGFKARADAFRSRELAQQPDTPVPFYLMPAPMQLVNDKTAIIATIREHLGDERPVAVVLDTLNRSLTGSESSDEDMSAYVQAADAIRDAFQCAVIVVHHCGIDGTRPRGHTSLTGAADAQLSVKRDAAKNVVVTVEFMKDGPEGDVVASSLESVDVGIDEDGDPITSCVVIPADSDAASTGQRAKVTGAAKVAFDLLLKALAEGGDVVPASNTIPPGTRTITLETWRAYCDAGMVSNTDNPDSRRRAFVRLVEKLQSLGLVGVHAGRAWRVGQAGQPLT